MLIILINLFVVGFVTGFLFSIPIAGPIAVLVVTNSLKNRARFADRVALGAAIVDAFYVFIAMFGITALIKYYQPFIPYLFLLGGVILFFVARKIFRTKFTLESVEKEKRKYDEEKGGFRTGLLINFTNPGIFFGWLTSSFLVLSLAASLNLSTGGMERVVGKNVTEVSRIAKSSMPSLKKEALPDSSVVQTKGERVEISPHKALWLSASFAAGIGFGGYFWFLLFGRFIRKHRTKFRPSQLNFSLKIFAFFIFAISFYFFYMGFKAII